MSIFVDVSNRNFSVLGCNVFMLNGVLNAKLLHYDTCWDVTFFRNEEITSSSASSWPG